MARKEAPKKIRTETTYRFILEPYRGRGSRIACPSCGTNHSFAPYIDTVTGERLPDQYGRCNRVEHCGHHNIPDGKIIENKPLFTPVSKVKKEFIDNNLFISTIDPRRVINSLTFKDKFSSYLFKTFSEYDVISSLLKYKVGEDDKWEGSTVFWQVDQEMDVRTGKIILYDNNGKRVKKPFPKVFWAHTPDKNLETVPDYNLKQCLFGTHLITDEVEEYHVVEAEKTAVVCSIVDSKKVWLGCGGIEMLNDGNLEPLLGKKVVFYPDKGEKAMTKWQNKLKQFDGKIDYTINSGLEKTKLPEGSDLADYLIDKFGTKFEID